jgi:hypothetical protein
MVICTALDVNIKKMSNKNIISVNEDILKSALTLFLFLTATGILINDQNF